MDPRLRAAVDASIGWYDDLCALHHVASSLRQGLWLAAGEPPPLHSDAVAVEPSVTADHVLHHLAGRGRAGFKDSFATVDLSGAGLDLLFAATWIHRAAAPPPADREPATWTQVRDAAELASWTAHHDTAHVLLPGLLERAHFAVLAEKVDGELVAGAVARLGSGVVDVSNVWAAPGHAVDWDRLALEIGERFPARAIVGYERGDDLAAALASGFEPVGELRVWVR